MSIPITIPIRAIPTGAGSQPEQQGDENWAYLPLPSEIETWRAPPTPEPGEPGSDGVRQLLREMVEVFDAKSDQAQPLIFPLAALDADTHRLLAQLLGEGEVSARVVLTDEVSVQIQESRYAGVWRVVTQAAGGKILDDYLEIGAIPAILLEQADSAPVGAKIPPTEGHHLMNAPSIASEIEAAHKQAVESGGAGNHIINFTLLPVTPEDLAWLDTMLGEGRVGLFSTGYGKCMVTATALRHVWRVRYFEGMGKILLDSLEITRIPEVVLAAPDDLADSMRHLREIIAWLEPDHHV